MMESPNSHPMKVRLPVAALGTSLPLFLAITYTLSVLFDLWVPGAMLYGSWLRLLPGMHGPSWTGFVFGLAESVVIGWYVAVVFAAIFNATFLTLNRRDGARGGLAARRGY